MCVHAGLQEAHTRQPILPPVLRKLVEPGRGRDVLDRSRHHCTKQKEAGEETNKVVLLRRQQPSPDKLNQLQFIGEGEALRTLRLWDRARAQVRRCKSRSTGFLRSNVREHRA